MGLSGSPDDYRMFLHVEVHETSARTETLVFCGGALLCPFRRFPSSETIHVVSLAQIYCRFFLHFWRLAPILDFVGLFVIWSVLFGRSGSL